MPAFDGDRAYQYLVDQVDFGPRVPGSQAASDCRSYFIDHFRTLGLRVDSQAFTFFDPYSKTDIRLVNLIVQYGDHSETKDRMLLVAHYDSRPRTDYASDTALRTQPLAGANDGASGVAVLMEIANLLAGQAPDCRVDLLLVDGEDWGRAGDDQYYMLGSKEFGRRVDRSVYRFGIVLDMIGDRDLQIYREQFSEQFATEVNNMVFDVASRIGATSFIDTVRYAIKDDHLSLNVAGIPTVDLIDFDYPYWHTENDTPDKCSAASLQEVGNVVAHIIYDKKIWPGN